MARFCPSARVVYLETYERYEIRFLCQITESTNRRPCRYDHTTYHFEDAYITSKVYRFIMGTSKEERSRCQLWKAIRNSYHDCLLGSRDLITSRHRIDRFCYSKLPLKRYTPVLMTYDPTKHDQAIAAGRPYAYLIKDVLLKIASFIVGPTRDGRVIFRRLMLVNKFFYNSLKQMRETIYQKSIKVIVAHEDIYIGYSGYNLYPFKVAMPRKVKTVRHGTGTLSYIAGTVISHVSETYIRQRVHINSSEYLITYSDANNNSYTIIDDLYFVRYPTGELSMSYYEDNKVATMQAYDRVGNIIATLMRTADEVTYEVTYDVYYPLRYHQRFTSKSNYITIEETSGSIEYRSNEDMVTFTSRYADGTLEWILRRQIPVNVWSIEKYDPQGNKELLMTSTYLRSIPNFDILVLDSEIYSKKTISIHDIFNGRLGIL